MIDTVPGKRVHWRKDNKSFPPKEKRARAVWVDCIRASWKRGDGEKSLTRGKYHMSFSNKSKCRKKVLGSTWVLHHSQ